MSFFSSTIVVCSIDNGDGSSSCHFFNDEKAAEEYCKKLEAFTGEPVNPENIYQKTFHFDINGKLLNPDRWED
jgi:hypothetical protein